MCEIGDKAENSIFDSGCVAVRILQFIIDTGVRVYIRCSVAVPVSVVHSDQYFVPRCHITEQANSEGDGANHQVLIFEKWKKIQWLQSLI